MKMSVNKIKIAVIGGGIIGTSSALLLIESIPNIEITIISEKLSPNTTGDVSAGLIYPYLSGKSADKVRQWLRETNKFLQSYFLSPDAGRIGISLLSMYNLSENEVYERPDSDEDMISERKLTAKELQLFPSKWKSGSFITSYFAECTKMLPFFYKQFKSKGGKIVQKRINSLEELIGKYDIVINCTGVEASKLVNDKKVKPIRGQVFRVLAPWIKHAVMTEHYYIIPNSETVVLGGTQQYDDWNLEVDPNDSKKIMKGCCELFPSLKEAVVVKEWVGLRPGREEVRLETELIGNGKNQLYVVHNYGHGGSGVTLFRGCAQEVLQNVNQIIVKNLRAKL